MRPRTRSERAERAVYCREYTLLKQTGTTVMISPLKCRCWHCEECVPALRRRVQELIRRGRPQRFITLTWRATRPETPDAAARLLIEAFRNLLRVLRYKHPNKEIEYFCVTERTKSGFPHLHIMFRGPYISQEWLSAYMEKAIDAPIVDIRLIDKRNDKVSYVTKYLTKDNVKFQGCQRFWRSRGWLLDPPKNEPTCHLPGDRFYMSRDGVPAIAALLERQGYRICTKEGMIVAELDRRQIHFAPRTAVENLARILPGTHFIKTCE